MSGILDSIVRRRRASASSRLGPEPAATVADHPSPENGASLDNGHVNGAEVPVVIFHALQAAALAQNGAGCAETVVEPAPDDGSPAAEPEVAEHEDAEPTSDAASPAPESDEQSQADETRGEPASNAGSTSVALEEEATTELAAIEPVEPTDPAEPTPTFIERGRIRRRARYLRQLREIQLRDIGGFMVELRRFGRERPDLIAAKLEDAARTDRELRTLEQALGSDQSLRELRVAGVGGACGSCGAVHGSADKFCSSCGTELAADREDSAPQS